MKGASNKDKERVEFQDTFLTKCQKRCLNIIRTASILGLMLKNILDYEHIQYETVSLQSTELYKDKKYLLHV